MLVSERIEVREASRFERLAGWAYRRRWWALILWVVVLVGVTAASQMIGSDYHNDYSLPGTESQEAVDTLNAHGSARAGDTITIVVQAPDGVSAQRVQVEQMLDEVAQLPHVVEVSNPYQEQGTISEDGTIGYATVLLDGSAQDVPVDDVRRIIETAQAAQQDGLRVELGGEAVRGAEESEGGAAEGIGLFAALIILVILFGSVVAASLPILVAVFAVGSAIGVTILASNLATIADFTPPLMMLVGLGVGIDYALLIFSRFRSELLQGRERQEAVRVALDTAGRTVFFACLTVIIALGGLVALGLGAMQGMAIAVAVTVLVTMIASVTLLPALLALLGGRIERQVRRRARRERHTEGNWWRRWATAVQRRPWLATVVSVVGLLALAAPALDTRLGFADAGNDPASSTSRQAYDLLAEGFGPGTNGPLILVAEGDTMRIDPLVDALGQVEGVAAVTPPIPSRDGGLATIMVFPDSAPQDAETSELVERLREEVLPAVERDTGLTILVGGATAAADDFSTALSTRLPIFIAIVVGLSALLLLVVFRSLLIPVKAAVLNLLSVGASLGVITLVFQKGFLAGPLGVEPGPIEAFVPVMIFAIAFGLSMDYEVFLLSRMHEAWERDRDAAAAIREGIATTGRIVTAAAAIMVVVFGAFLFSPDRMLKQFGLGLAVAVLLDAVIIRCLILPAVMQLLGKRAWWLPNWLSRLVPRVAIEHH